MTAPTRLVVGVLLETDAHLTADDLIATVGRRKKGIAPSTVYRVLQRLSEVGVVEHVHPGDGPAFYHLREGGHAHLVCHRCNAVIDIADGALAGLAKKVDEAHGFALDTHHAALLGLCAAVSRGRWDLTDMAIDSEAPPGAQEEHGFLPIPDVKAWRSIYASRGDEPRHRRAADAVLFVVAALGLLVASLISNSSLAGEANAVSGLQDLLDWLDPIWRATYTLASFISLALIVVAFATKRRALGFMLVVSIALVIAVGEVVGHLVTDAWIGLKPIVRLRRADLPAHPHRDLRSGDRHRASRPVTTDAPVLRRGDHARGSRCGRPRREHPLGRTGGLVRRCARDCVPVPRDGLARRLPAREPSEGEPRRARPRRGRTRAHGSADSRRCHV